MPIMGMTTYELLGVRVNPVTAGELLQIICDAIAGDRRIVIGNHNLHSLYLVRHDHEMRGFFADADLAYIDGMSLILSGKVLGLPLKRSQRVTFLDVVDTFMQDAAANGWRLFFLGAKPGVAERAASRIREHCTGIILETSDGYFDAAPASAENRAVIAQIRAFRPNVVLVGMGMSRQEYWVLNHRHEVDANVTIVLGGIFDYLSGDIPTPPRRIGQIGFEWLFRLCCEPRRLWRRYLVEPWFLLILLAKDIARRGRRS